MSEPKLERRQSSLKYKKQLHGHEKSLEDVAFKPGNAHMLCSVGVDRKVLVWDLRSGQQPVITLREVHSSDINTVDWSKHDEWLLSTGSNDTLVKLLDLRQSGNPIISCLHKHKSKVDKVKFADFDRRYLASSGDSLVFWDI